MAKEKQYKVNYVPDFVRHNMKSNSPCVVEIGNIYCEQPNADVKRRLRTYILLGGIPTPGLHELLTTVGFKLWNGKREYKDKEGKMVQIVDSSKRCWSSYHNEEDTLSKAQVKAVGKILLAAGKMTKTGQTFLCPTWEHVDFSWEDRENWLTIFTGEDKVIVEEEEEEGEGDIEGDMMQVSFL